MNGPRFRAWRFGLPTEEVERTVGLQYSVRGGVEMVQDDDSIRQAILLLIATIPGERVMRPEYGCHLHRLVFSPNDDTTAGLAIHYVRRAIDRWEPRVDVLGIDAERSAEDANRLDITLEYRVRASQRTHALRLPFDVQGERAA